MILAAILQVHLDKYQFPGFRKGFYQLRISDHEEVRRKIYEVLEINNKQSFYHYLYGRQEPTQSKAIAIEQIFSEYGISDIWGMPEKLPAQ
jgi:hypothetical protein